VTQFLFTPIGAVGIRYGKRGTSSCGKTSLPGCLAPLKRLRKVACQSRGSIPVRRIGRDANNLSEVPLRAIKTLGR
jgi:hypothetical protein